MAVKIAPLTEGDVIWSPSGDVELVVLSCEPRHGLWVCTLMEEKDETLTGEPDVSPLSGLEYGCDDSET